MSLLTFLAGCYAYVPLDTARPVAGTRVRAHLTDDGTLQLTRYLGRGISLVDGSIVRDGRDTLSLAVHSVTNWQEIEQYWEGESVALPRGMISRLEERRFSASRTALFTGGLVLGTVALRALFDLIGDGNGGSDSGGPPGTS